MRRATARGRGWPAVERQRRAAEGDGYQKSGSEEDVVELESTGECCASVGHDAGVFCDATGARGGA